MATALQGFRLTARSCTCRPVVYKYIANSIGTGRAFSTTPTSLRWKNQLDRPIHQKIAASNTPEARTVLGADEAANTAFWGKEMEEFMEDEWDEMEERLHERYPPYKLPGRAKRLKNTFLNMGDPEPWEDEDTMEDDDDDITALAHGELERHREMRHYARLAAWEMPMLSKLAKPFVPPSKDMPLRFRYTTYMGEQHPAEKKVVLEFATADMPNLEPIQREKLKKLAGVRYNPETDIVKMSCEMYETQAQNKRYLGDLVDSLLREARDPVDAFEDVPLDTRHHYFKKTPKFPEEWKMTDQRASELAKYRQHLLEKDLQKELAGKLIDGIKQIQEGLANATAPIREVLPEMVMAGRGMKGKAPKRLAVRR